MLKFVANEWLDSTGSGCCPMTKFSEGCNGPQSGENSGRGE